MTLQPKPAPALSPRPASLGATHGARGAADDLPVVGTAGPKPQAWPRKVDRTEWPVQPPEPGPVGGTSDEVFPKGGFNVSGNKL
jgi:hypothetical protein